MSLTDVEEINTDSAVVAILPELGDIFTSEEEQRIAQRAFLTGKDVFSLLSSWQMFSQTLWRIMALHGAAMHV